MTRFLFAWLLLVPASLVIADDYKPQIAGASDEGQLAIQGFQVPEGTEVKLFAAEPLLANPVVFGIDQQGRVFVCETFRQSKGVEDNRGHMNWLEDDLSLNTVEERVAMFRKYLGDGVYEYMKEQDRIRLLTDTDGDGVADAASIFAGGFNAIEDGTGAGVLAYKGDVFYTCIPKLWRLRDTDGDGVAEQRDALHDGYGVRVAFRGHDMHGLQLGPDGRLYYSIGDRGYNVTTQEGESLVRPDTGAVFRCELDGSHLEVFAFGLRNPQELAFDDYGNLFTGDNNSDSGDQARWVQVVEGGDTGWRMYFQYLPDRGPWNRERIWYPYRADEQTTAVQPANTIPPILNLGDGPSGLVYYPGVGLPDRYQGHFFLADFRGSAGQSGIRSFGLEPQGASFKVVDSHWFLKSILATDVDFGYDGKMYVSDWVDGWNGPGKGRIYTFSWPESKRAQDLGIASLMKAGMDGVPDIKLVGLLGHPDRRVRLEAQFEMVDRQLSGPLSEIARTSENQFARIHAVWGLGQLLRRSDDQGDLVVAAPLLALLEDQDPEIRAQAARVLGDGKFAGAVDGLIKLVEAGTPREQYLAAISLGKLKDNKAQQALVMLLHKNNNEDPVVRHAAVMGLTGVSSPTQLAGLAPYSSAAQRLGLVLALRRHRAEELKLFLNDPEPGVVDEAARAIHDEMIEAALPALAAVEPLSTSSDALLRRIMNANFRLGGVENAQRVALMAANDRLSPTLRLEAATQLLLWNEPPKLDRVTNQFRPLEPRQADLGPIVQPRLGAILSGDDKLRTQGVKLAARFGISDVGPQLAALVEDHQQPPQVRRESLAALAALKYSGLTGLVESALQDSASAVRAEARSILARTSPEKAVEELQLVVRPVTTEERQSAVATLEAMNSAEADRVLLNLLGQFTTGELPRDIQLDVLAAASKRSGEEFKSLLKTIEEGRSTEDPLAKYLECLEGGNRDRGKEIFFGNAAASCRRCHKINGEGSDVGPDLSGVGKLNPREYLLESIVNPNARIAKGFETAVFALDDGRIVSGIVKSEDETSYRIVSGTGESTIVEKARIEEQAVGKSGMPEDIIKQLSKSDLRDLVEYLSSLKTPVVQEGH